MRITGKLLKDENGKYFGCRECLNTSHSDSCVILQAIDTDYHKPIYKVQNQIDNGNMEVVRDLHDSGNLETRKTIIDGEVK